MPPKRSRSTSSTVARRPVKARATASRLFTREEKRELIRAHAAMRVPHDPIQQVSVWAGVLAACLVVIGGWVWTIQPVLSSFLRHPIDPETRALIQTAASLKREIGSRVSNAEELTQKAAVVVERLDGLVQDAERSEQALDRMAMLVNTTTTIFTTTTRMKK